MARSISKGGLGLLAAGIIFSSFWLPKAQAQDTQPYKPAANPGQAVERIEKLGGAVRRVSAKSDALEVDFKFSGDKLSDEHLQYLQQLPDVVILNLKNTKISNQGLVHVGKISSLKRLHLEQTGITDDGLKNLTGLGQLEYLNVFGTKVGDQGLEVLKDLPKLKQLFVFQTQVSEEGMARLEKANPEIQIQPNPARRRKQAKIIWEVSKRLLADAEKAYAIAKKDAKELPPKRDQLKKEAKAARKRYEDARRRTGEFRKKFDRAERSARDSRRRLEDAKRQLQRDPKDNGLKRRYEERKKQAAKDQQLADQLRKEYDKARKIESELNKKSEEARNLESRAANARRTFEEAEKLLELERQREAYARKTYARLTGS